MHEKLQYDEKSSPKNKKAEVQFHLEAKNQISKEFFYIPFTSQFYIYPQKAFEQQYQKSR